MRIGVDARSLTDNRGVAHYTGALVRALAEERPADEWLLFVPGRGPLATEPDLGALANVRVRRHPLPSRALFGSAAIARAPRLDRLLGGGLDAVWAPAPAPLALSAGVPLVLTVHDLSFEERPRDFTPYERLWHRLARPRELARRAARIMVDAAPTGEALRTRWAVPAERIAVVTPGVSRPAAPVSAATVRAVRERHGLADSYLLAVGALEPRKAPELLLRAHARARERGLEAELVFAGGGRLATRLNGPGVRLLGHVSEDELSALYAGACALVMPSWLEGFGLPPLEALARGTPAVVSGLPVYDQTLGDGALRFPPGDEPALAEALLTITSDAGLRARLVAAGQVALERLTWARAARVAGTVLAEAAQR